MDIASLKKHKWAHWSQGLQNHDMHILTDITIPDANITQLIPWELFGVLITQPLPKWIPWKLSRIKIALARQLCKDLGVILWELMAREFSGVVLTPSLPKLIICHFFGVGDACLR